jgi:hypothetical protein
LIVVVLIASATEKDERSDLATVKDERLDLTMSRTTKGPSGLATRTIVEG